VSRHPSATWRKLRRRLHRHGYSRAIIAREVYPHGTVVYRGCVYDASGELVQGCKHRSRRRARRSLACTVWFFETMRPFDKEQLPW
jgi:hypothetical protein